VLIIVTNTHGTSLPNERHQTKVQTVKCHQVPLIQPLLAFGPLLPISAVVAPDTAFFCASKRYTCCCFVLRTCDVNPWSKTSSGGHIRSLNRRFLSYGTFLPLLLRQKQSHVHLLFLLRLDGHSTHFYWTSWFVLWAFTSNK
jgi:hypothetical protein